MGIIITIDRPGPRGYVVVQDEREREAVLPAAWFPEKPREGEVFELSLVANDALTAKRRNEVQDLIDELSTSPESEDSESSEPDEL